VGKRKVKLSYSVDVDIDAIIEWPERGSYREDDDDPREVTELKGATERDQVILDAILEHDSREPEQIHYMAIETHDASCQEELAWDAVKARLSEQVLGRHVYRHLETKEQKVEREAREKIAETVLNAADAARNEARIYAVNVAGKVDEGEGPITEAEVHMVALVGLSKKLRVAIAAKGRSDLRKQFNSRLLDELKVSYSHADLKERAAISEAVSKAVEDVLNGA
jgi:hypothetical protein